MLTRRPESIKIILLAALLAVASGASHGRGGEGFSPPKKNEIVFGMGAAATNGDSFLYAPILSIVYLRKSRSIFGNRWEAIIGLSKGYGGVAWQYDARLLEHFRIGAGLGVTPFPDAMPGNPILVPMPELSIGFDFEGSGLVYTGAATGNLVYGARASAGLGFSF